MALVATDNGTGGNFKAVPAGNHIGRCFRIIDLGTQSSDYQGQHRTVRKVILTWELFGEDDAGDPLVMDDDKPLTISKRYTLSLNEKANLRADLEAWRGRVFTEDELKGFDLSKLLGVYGMVNVKQDTREGKTYSNVASLSPIPKVLKNSLPEPFNPLYTFDADKPDMDIYNSLHDKLKETIAQCAEWQKGKSPADDGYAALAETVGSTEEEGPPF